MPRTCRTRSARCRSSCSPVSRWCRSSTLSLTVTATPCGRRAASAKLKSESEPRLGFIKKQRKQSHGNVQRRQRSEGLRQGRVHGARSQLGSEVREGHCEGDPCFG